MTVGAEVAGKPRARAGQVLAKALSLLRRRLSAIAVLALLFGYLPSAFFGLSLLAKGLAEGDWTGVNQLEAWVIFIFNIPLVLAVTHIGLADMAGRQATLGEALSVAWKRLIGGGWVMVVASAGIGVATLLLVIPGVIVALMWMVAVPLKLAEGGPATQVLTRSGEMTAGARWPLLAVLLACVAVLLAVYAGWYYGLQALLYQALGDPTVLLTYVVIDPLFNSFVLVTAAVVPVAVFDELGGAARVLPMSEIVD